MNRNSLLLLFALLLTCAESWAQDVLKKTVGRDFISMPIGTILNELEKDLQVNFFFSEDLIPKNKIITVRSKGRPLNQTLSIIFQSMNIGFRAEANKIILKKNETNTLPSSLRENAVIQDSSQKRLSLQILDLETGEAITGATVEMEGRPEILQSDENGRFYISSSINLGTALYISHVAYEKKTVRLGEVKSILLSPLNNSMKNVVVVGYGSQRKRDLTGVVSSVSEQQLKQVAVGSVEHALQGRVPGMVVTQSSAAPGGGISIRIRGGNSLQGGNEPLYVIDGFPVYSNNDDAEARVANINVGKSPNFMSSLNLSDIESIEVLKDASATAIYGARGSNGVVIITTKKGKRGRNQVNLETQYGVQSVSKKLDLLNAEQYALLVNEARLFAGQTEFFSNPSSFGTGTNWQEQIFRNAPMQNYNLNINGGDDKTLYSISGGYFDQQGIIFNSDLKRINLRLNLEKKVSDKFTIGTNILTTRTTTNRVISESNGGTGAGVIQAAFQISPTLPVFDPSGNYVNNLEIPFAVQVDNPVATAKEITNRFTTLRLLGTTFGELKLSKSLRLKSSLGADISYSVRETVYPGTTLRGQRLSRPAATGYGEITSILNENTIQYQKQHHPNHRTDAVAGITFQQLENRSASVQMRGFLNDIYGINNLGAGPTFNNAQSNKFKWTMTSFLARINHTIQDKYLFTVSARADGVSRFGNNNKYGFFPSAAFAWRLSKESFLAQQNAINDLKLRLSFGVVGNQEIGQYQSLARLTNANYVFSNTIVSGIGPTSIANPNLGWETTAQWNAGIDLSLWNNTINFTGDFYYKKTNDLLYSLRVPLSSGFQTSLQNIGSIENKGFEFGLNFQPQLGDIKLSADLIYSRNISKVLGLGEVEEFFGASVPGSVGIGAAQIIQVGQPLGTFYGYRFAGLFQSEEERVALQQNGSYVGGRKYADLNGDNAVTAEDRTILGFAQPKFTASLGSTLEWRGFDFNFLLYGVYGNQILNVNKFLLENVRGNSNQLVTVLNRWTPSNRNTNIPRANANATYNLFSDNELEDGSFLRARTVGFGYKFPKFMMNKGGIQGLRVGISVQNLFTLTNYTGYDPESSWSGQSSLNFGYDFEPYPNAKTILFHLTLNL